jgi:hypothetical protein
LFSTNPQNAVPWLWLMLNETGSRFLSPRPSPLATRIRRTVGVRADEDRIQRRRVAGRLRQVTLHQVLGRPAPEQPVAAALLDLEAVQPRLLRRAQPGRRPSPRRISGQSSSDWSSQ